VPSKAVTLICPTGAFGGMVTPALKLPSRLAVTGAFGGSGALFRLKETGASGA